MIMKKLPHFNSKDEKIPGPEPKKPLDVESMIQMVYKCVHCPKGKMFTHQRWFSVRICKYKPGYKSLDLLQIRVLLLVENLFKKDPLKDFSERCNFKQCMYSTRISNFKFSLI